MSVKYLNHAARIVHALTPLDHSIVNATKDFMVMDAMASCDPNATCSNISASYSHNAGNITSDGKSVDSDKCSTKLEVIMFIVLSPTDHTVVIVNLASLVMNIIVSISTSA